MRIAIVTDLHQTAPGATVQGVDTAERLSRCVTAIGQLAADAKLRVAMGDLVEEPDEVAYAGLVDRLRPLPMPVKLMVGNHDDRGILRAAWPALDDDGAGFAQGVIRVPGMALLFLDTAEPGTHEGRYCSPRLAWLERQLGEVADLPVVVFMHHPPAALGNWSDRTRLREHREVGDLLRSHGRVLHILSGHTHRACSGTWRGIAWTVLHGIGPQATLAWGRDVRPDYLDGPAQVAILDIENGDLRVHAVDVSGNARTWRRTG